MAGQIIDVDNPTNMPCIHLIDNVGIGGIGGLLVFTGSDVTNFRNFLKSHSGYRMCSKYAGIHIYWGEYKRAKIGKDELYDPMSLQHQGWGVKTISAVSTLQSFAQATTVTQMAQKGAMKAIPYLIPSGDLEMPKTLLREKNRPFKRGDVKKGIFNQFMAFLGRGGLSSRYFLSFSYRDGSSGHPSGLRGQEKIALLGYVEPNESINFEQIVQQYF